MPTIQVDFSSRDLSSLRSYVPTVVLRVVDSQMLPLKRSSAKLPSGVGGKLYAVGGTSASAPVCLIHTISPLVFADSDSSD